MTRTKALYVSAICLSAVIYQAKSQTMTLGNHKEIDFDFLLSEMLNREQLAIYPRGTWTLHHASSYDRSSVSKDQPGWFANKDWDNYIRKDSSNGDAEYVVLDASGPGVITRFWVAGHPNKKAHLRFYIDGQSLPFWEADHTGALIGQNKDIGVPLSQRSIDLDSLRINAGAQPGHNLYAPIPFKHHMKVTYDRAPGGADDGFWYNIDYRIYQPGTVVNSFSAQALLHSASRLRQTNDALTHFMETPAKTAVVEGIQSTKNASFNLAPGGSKFIRLPGTGSIRSLLLSVEGDSLNNAIRNLMVQIDFDGRRTVSVPAGFFFGCGDQLVEVRNWYNKVELSGMLASYWVMPYHQGAVIQLSNKGNENIAGSITIGIGGWKWTKSSMLFHAAYQRMDNYLTKAQQGRDFNYIDLNNKAGVYVGDMLQVNKAVGGWWGEGDEKIYVDGSTFPDDFGTGSEDYYGYAWGHPETFNHIFNSQPLGSANLTNAGGTTVNSRERDLDGIPFRKSLRFDMESWNWFGGPVNYAWTCFWYEVPKKPMKQ